MKWLKTSLALLLLSWVTAPAFADPTEQDFSAVFQGTGDAPYVIVDSTLPADIIQVTDQGVWDGKALWLTQNVGSQNNSVAFNQLVSGPYDQLVIGMEMEFTLYDPPSSGGADGFGLAYANSAIWGSDNSWPIPTFTTPYPPVPDLAEEPSLAGSLGVGFDIYSNAAWDGVGQNTISLHWNNKLLENRSLDLGEWGDLFLLESGTPIRAEVAITPTGSGSNVTVLLVDLETGDIAIPFEDYFIDGLTPYDGRLVAKARTGGVFSEQFVDNVSLALTPQGGGETFTFKEGFEDFPIGVVQPPEEPDPPILQGGTPYATYQNPAAPLGPTVTSDGLPTGAQPAHMQLTTAVQSLTNSIAFDQTDAKADNITATFKMKIDSGGLADGMTFALLDVDTYSSSGPFEAPLADTIYYEEPNFPGTLAIGFDIYDGGEEANPDYIDEVDPDGCGGEGACLDARANHISVHWDGAIVGKAVRLNPAEFDLVNGQWNDVTVLAEQVEGGMNVTVAIIDADGNVLLPFSDYFVEGASFPDGARAAFGGRTGGSTSTQRIDDVYITWTGGAGQPGDFNGDGVLGAADLDEMAIAMSNPPADQKYDVNNDGQVNFEDREYWVGELKNTWIGDTNLNGEFDSNDFVQVFSAGKYESGAAAGWEEGDWDGNRLFESGDFVAAFADGGYEIGPRPDVAAVPEPTTVLLSHDGLDRGSNLLAPRAVLTAD